MGLTGSIDRLKHRWKNQSPILSKSRNQNWGITVTLILKIFDTRHQRVQRSSLVAYWLLVPGDVVHFDQQTGACYFLHFLIFFPVLTEKDGKTCFCAKKWFRPANGMWSTRLLVEGVRSTHTEIVESNQISKRVSKVKCIFVHTEIMQDNNNEVTHSIYRQIIK